MAQSAKLQLRQSQALALTPQLMQSIKLLQMSAVELSGFVQGEIDSNPFLELKNAEDASAEATPGQYTEQSGPQTSKHEQQPAPDGQPRQSSPGTAVSDAGNLEAYVASQQSLSEFLLQQAALTFHSTDELRIARNIIDLIDRDGYLREDLSPLCKGPETDIAKVLGILGHIQKFDPPGVGARSLAECMRLQLAERNRLDPAMEIFTDNLDLLARRDYRQLALLCGVDHEDLMDMAQEIQQLEPRPGDAFDTAPVHNVIPDVFVRENKKGDWQIELNSQTLPKVLVNREYYAEIKNLTLKKSDKKFMVDKLQSASWLVASLDQRARTILKVATQIVKQQDMFFVKGKEFLKPLTLKAVAEQIDMHESTISRVTRNKYLSCERGNFEFKYFFMSGITGKDGNAGYGSRSIRTKIENLIVSETRNNVLSDEKIAGILAEDGIIIARRTVTKYRESTGLLSSIERRRELNALAFR